MVQNISKYLHRLHGSATVSRNSCSRKSDAVVARHLYSPSSVLSNFTISNTPPGYMVTISFSVCSIRSS